MSSLLRKPGLRAGVTGWAVALMLSGCQTPPPAAPAGEQPLPPSVVAVTDQAMALAASQRGLARFVRGPMTVYVAPVLDTPSRQQTAATVRVRELIVEQLKARHPEVRVVPFTAEAAAAADARLDTTLAAVTQGDGRRSGARYLLDMRMISLSTGEVLSQSRTTVVDTGLDTTPVGFYRDSPFTMSPAQSQVAAEAARLTERQRTLPIGRLDEAIGAYSAGRYDQALDLYRNAATLPGTDEMQSLVGAYLASARTGRDAESRESFSRIVALGLKTRAMGVKLLFAPGKTEFWPDPSISKPYPEWLREIARQSSQAGACLQVVGHSSHTGSEAFNQTLSGQRAEAVRQQLEAADPALVRRVSTAGVGWRDNLVGTGTDDLRDAVDRRVEFKVVDCR